MNKYNARKVELDGYIFDSKREAARYQELKLLLRNDDIENLQIHVPYPMVHEDKKICIYEADFVYWDCLEQKKVVEDVKSEVTRKLPIYVLKKKMMKIFHNIEILET